MYTFCNYKVFHVEHYAGLFVVTVMYISSVQFEEQKRVMTRAPRPNVAPFAALGRDSTSADRLGS